MSDSWFPFVVYKRINGHVLPILENVTYNFPCEKQLFFKITPQ